ncbi:Methylenomycin A resistance protein (MMR peptide) [Bifidobacterium saguini DSM 23967]|uniref:Methylenomycin A resistance protein (MMR peptide) n=2 Tax=Bifidobacterium saguini TaxID=762210 RepID=A0A087DF14_9BIFI|nr:MFS transporter [Bifidobacterium saguini]KFI94114.1 Methylenomycin A resistance protein (MMR peptide) [Bifidobacterium saguini DSM 23967]
MNSVSKLSSNLTTAAAAVASFLAGMDVLIVNVALPTIAKELGGSMAVQQWVVDGYTLLFAALLLLAGSLADQFGAKRIFIIGAALFGAASLFCSFAWSMMALVAGRCVLGIASALLLPASMSLINEASPNPRYRAWALALWGAGGASASAVGPLLGGLLTPIHWSLVFAINVPFCLMILAVTPRIAPSPRRATKFDWIGQVLALIGLSTLVAGIIQVGSAGLSAPSTLVLLIVGVVMLVAFGYSQAKVASPMMPLGLFHVRGMQVALQIGFIMIFNWYGMVFICTMFLQNELNMNPFAAGLVFVPSAFVTIFGNLMGGRIVTARGSKFSITLGLSIMIAGFLFEFLTPQQIPVWVIATGLSVVGFGAAITTPAAAGVVLKSVDAAQAGIASAMFNTFRQVGGAIGVAVFGVIATFLPSLDLALRSVFLASALLLVYVLVFELLRWKDFAITAESAQSVA